jgi:hypothetical protein
MTYPTLEQVETADHMQLCRWIRFLPSPGRARIGQSDFEETLEVEGDIMDRIIAINQALGGFTPEISKQIGWG